MLLTVLAGFVGLSLVTQMIQVAGLLSEFGGTALAWWLTNLAVLVAFVSLHRAARRGRHRLASVVVVGLLSALALALVVTDGVEHPMWPLVLALAVVLAAILRGGPAAAGTVTAAALVIVPLAGLQHSGSLAPLALEESRTPSDARDATGLVAVLGFLALVCVLFARDGLSTIDETLSHGAEASPLRRLRTRELTLREVEVVQLVAEGLSNDAIAARLFVSARTVQSHVANAMRKAGCSNRTELGVLAVREGLAPLETTGARPLGRAPAHPVSRRD